MNSNNKELALIVGGSTGIGKETAKHLLQRGVELFRPSLQTCTIKTRRIASLTVSKVKNGTSSILSIPRDRSTRLRF